MKTIRPIFALLFILLPALGFAQPWFIDQGGYFSKGTGAVINGYDPVAYFTQNKAIMGKPEINFTYEGGLFFFANAEDKKLFEAEPQKYVPQYGGYCAYAVGAKNQLVKVDPTVWTIIDGKLYLNYSKSVQKLWAQNIPGYIKKGDDNWKNLQQPKGD